MFFIFKVWVFMEASYHTENFFDHLPQESLVGIFEFLTRRDLGNTTQVCQRFHQILPTMFGMNAPAAVELKALQQIDTIRSLFLSEPLDMETTSIVRESYQMHLYWDNSGTIQAYSGDNTGWYIRRMGDTTLKYTDEQVDTSKLDHLEIHWTEKEGMMYAAIPGKNFKGHLIHYTSKIYEAARHIEKTIGENNSLRWSFIIQDSHRFPTSMLLKTAQNL